MTAKRKRGLLRSVAFALLLATLISVLPMTVLATELSELIATSEELSPVIILHDGAEKSSVTIAENGKETLTALVTDISIDSRAWQIRTPDGEQWISIYGKSGDAIDVTYALVSSMLDDSGKAYLRHTVRSDGTEYNSREIEIVISHASGVARSTQYSSNATANASVAYNADSTGDTETGNNNETSQLVSIVINYVFDNGGLAFEPYGASIAKGSAFQATITSPDVVGYEPFRRVEIYDDNGNVVGSDYISAEQVVIDIETITADVTINVIYEPAIVDFAVHHHLQDLSDDAYSELPVYTTYSKGLTGSIVPENLAMDIEGFKSLAYDTSITIAADGSTVVEIRYDRIYYLVTFDMKGGYGTDPIYTRYGSSIGANPPTRHGYVFDGWELVEYNKNVPSDVQKSMYDLNGTGKTITLPAASLKYEARWITKLTTYTMVFWKENINDNGFTYWGYIDGLAAMSGTPVSGEDRVSEVPGIDDEAYFTYCPALTDKDVVVEGDGSTVVNVYYTRDRYTITIKATGKCVIPTGHTHTLDECYIALCKASHIHDDSCIASLRCELEEHTEHDDSCIRCGKTEHTHTNDCYCGSTEHTHSKDCWKNVGSAQSKAPTNAPKNPKDGQVYKRSNKYYIYIDGTWYTYNGTASSGDIVNRSCGYSTEHTHDSSCMTCGFAEEHTHSDSCYGDILHTHGESCYKYSCGATEHEHTKECYLLNCGIPEKHSHTTDCNNSTKTNTVKLVYRKYQQNIEDIWPITDDNGKTYNNGERWSPSNSNIYSQVLVFISNMPPENLTLTLNTSSYSAYTMKYYLEVLPGEEYDVTVGGRNYILYNTVKAKYNYITKAEDFFDIHGFDQLSSSHNFDSSGKITINSGSKEVSFYYSRMVDHALEFSSNGIMLDSHAVRGVMYGMPLSSYYFVPEYPSNLESGAYEFGGWYTSPGCFDGTEVDWNTLTMEAGGMLLYAKWKPKVHTVEIYSEYSNGVYKNKIGETQYVSHNYFASSPDQNPTNGNYIFQGWFYIDEDSGLEKAFVFTGIPVNQNMKIYARWSSHISVAYKINYVLYKDKTPIADSLTGQGIAGDNKTFHAKVENELYEGYRTGYYPLTSSHTVTMSAEVELHEFTFEYVYVESMPYAVRYVDENGELLCEMKYVMDNKLSVVTETFVKFDKMMPDAYQKRLILSADGVDKDKDNVLDNNVITFRYEQDSKHAYYRVVHYIQNIAADGYREYRSEETKGEIGTTYTFEPITITGFKFVAGKTMLNGSSVAVSGNKVSAKLDENGMLLELYYDRVNVKYTVNYLEHGTDKVLHEPKPGDGIFGGQVVEQAIKLTHEGYTLVGESIRQLHLSSNEESNVITFYYTESMYSLKYQLVGMEGSGSLSINSENVMAVSGTVNGSTPIVSGGYKFIGWFLDEACSVPVPEEWVDASTNKLTPQNETGVWTSNETYYAKIDPDVSSLTIKTQGVAAVDEGQVFIFRVKGVSDNVKDIDFTVTVIGDGSVTVSDLEIGEYTVTEITDWSFRYSVVNVEKSISLAVDESKNVITYGHIKTFNKWLDGNHSITNIFN